MMIVICSVGVVGSAAMLDKYVLLLSKYAKLLFSAKPWICDHNLKESVLCQCFCCVHLIMLFICFCAFQLSIAPVNTDCLT